MRRTRRTLLLLAAAPLVLVGCGDGGSDEKASPASESMPACASVWVEGKTLPADYAGCVDADGVLQVSEIKECSSTDGSFTTFGKEFFAYVGQPIHTGLDSQDYQQAYGICFGTDW
ncbi:MAG: hypothetical protein U0R80_15140 [Nocardioidaceae bacterium]